MLSAVLFQRGRGETSQAPPKKESHAEETDKTTPQTPAKEMLSTMLWSGPLTQRQRAG